MADLPAAELDPLEAEVAELKRDARKRDKEIAALTKRVAELERKIRDRRA
jgi:predicted  nucleic acid-binding Zn-ribbon protein